MSFGSFQDGRGGAPQPMAEINTTPLVDVMLVLLIIFIVTAPLLTHGIRIDLPKAASSVQPEKPDTVTLAVERDGRLFWNDQAISEAELENAMREAAARTPQPELQLRADRETRYQRLAELMSMARNTGLTRLGFVTDPNARPEAGEVPR
jgi:biopolymer transport protein ExbD